MRIGAITLALALSLGAQQASGPRVAELAGMVTFNGLPVPGAMVTASQTTTTLTATSGGDGRYAIENLKPGIWRIGVRMTGFAASERMVNLPAGATREDWELQMLPLAATAARQANQIASSTPAPAPAEAAAPSEKARQAAGGNRTAAPSFAVNGSVENGAASPYFQLPAFGNFRRGQNSLYNGALGGIFGLSALDAKPFSLTGQQSAKPAYARVTGLAQFGGPLIIPRLFSAANAPMFFVAYQMARDRSDTILSSLVPTAAERAGDLSQVPQPIVNPASGQAYAGNVIPSGDTSPQAAALLRLYPLPNAAGRRFNYQIPAVSINHEDDLQTRAMKRLNQNNQLAGSFALKSSRLAAPNLFGFLNTTDTLGLDASIAWRHTFSPQVDGTVTVSFSRLRLQQKPFFADRTNVSGQAGIAGNDQAAADWGPPSLTFASGFAGISDLLPADNRNQTGALSYTAYWNRGAHNFNFGGDFRRLEFNELQQQNPRGQLTFNGAATGDDFADFLLGLPDAAAIAFGNADKYFREASGDLYFTDDFRVSASMSVNAGLRWEFAAPITERYDRLVNLDIAPGFSAAAPVLASAPHGTLTGTAYPSSLVRPDGREFEPRIGLAWQPFATSPLIFRAGYGVYYNTSVYQTLAQVMAQQAPYSTSFSAAYSATRPWTLANVFSRFGGGGQDLFALDANFRPGYVQSWNASVQEDLPAALTLVLTYLGNKGTHAAQEILPNTYPAGGVNPCPSCPIGFAFISSGGDSSYEAAQLELRRRIVGGLAGDMQYTYGKAIDDGALGGGQTAPLLAQNWRDPDAERALSSFDQRQQWKATAQYTTGIGAHGGALLTGWQGALYKSWTVQAQLKAASGMPLTPVTFAIVPGTGVTQNIRPSPTGAPLYASPPGLLLNPAAYAPPPPGQWGSAGRDSITGPGQFSLNMALQRSFFVSDRITANLRIEADNVLNHVVFPSWDTVVGSAQFGLPLNADPMRGLKTYLRFVF